MKKKYILSILVAMAISSLGFSQNDSLFYYLDKSNLSNNILTNEPDSMFFGLLNGKNQLEFDNSFIYQVISSMKHLSFGEIPIPNYSIWKDSAEFEFRTNNRIPIAIVNYQYTRIKENAINDSLLIFDGEYFRDVFPRLESPYENDTLFFASILKEKLQKGSYTFYLSRDFYLSNISDPQEIYIDFGDGNGFVEIEFGESKIITYAHDGIKNIIIKIIGTNEDQFVSKVKTKDEYCQGGYEPVDEYIFVTAPNSNTHFNYQLTYNPSATVYVKYGKDYPGEFRKPLIFVEGIDFGPAFSYYQATSPAGYIRHGDIGWCEFWGKSYKTSEPNNYLFGAVEFKDSPGFLLEMHNQGYDILFVDFNDGADYIQRNSMVVVELIKIIKNRQAVGSYPYQPSVIIGASMGGQVAKLALSYMEKNNMKHCVRDYVSFDSPQQGANIPVSLQQWLNFFAKKGMNGGDPDALDNLEKKLNRPATRQLLVRYYDGNYAFERTNFQNLMAYYGYPSKLRKVAIASGARDGSSQQYLSSGQQILETKWNPSVCGGQTAFISGDCFTTGNNISFTGKVPRNSAKACLLMGLWGCPICVALGPTLSMFDAELILQPTNILNWDNAPGGNRYDSESFAYEFNKTSTFWVGSSATANPLNKPKIPRTTFIPTISALDINTTNLTTSIINYLPNSDKPHPSLYPFDAYYASATNQPHVQLENINLGLANSNLAWSRLELLDNEVLLPVILNTSINNGIFNLARIQSRLLSSCQIENGGKLFINADLNSDFGSLTIPMPSGGTQPPPPGSTLEVQTCFCDNVKVDVKNGGALILGDNATSNKAIVSINDGATLILRNGSVLRINDGSKLIILPGATLTIEPGALIELVGENALLDVQGIFSPLTLGNSQVVTFTKQAAALGGKAEFKTGLVRLNPNSSFINDGCRVYLNEFEYTNNALIELKNASSLLDIFLPTNISLAANQTLNVSKGNTTFGGTLNLNSINATNNMGLFDLLGNSSINNTDCRIILNNYSFSYYKDAEINLSGDEAMLRFGGRVLLKSDAEFQFNGSGYFSFNLIRDYQNYHNLASEPGARVNINGANKSDLIIEIMDETWVSNDICPISIKNGKMLLKDLAWINIGGDVVLNNIDVYNDVNYHAGILLNGQKKHSIDNITISKGIVGLTCRNYFGGYPVVIKNSTFYDNTIGLSVIDKGFSLINCNFMDNDRGWKADLISHNSIASNCLIQRNQVLGSSFSTVGTAQLLLSKCTYTDNESDGIKFAGNNRLVVRCGTYNNIEMGINAYNNAQVIMSPLIAYKAGKVDAGNNGLSNISLGLFNGNTGNNYYDVPGNFNYNSDAKSLFIEKGYNILTGGNNSYLPNFQLYGRVKDCLNINNNQWETSASSDISNYSIFSYLSCMTSANPHSLGYITNLTDQNSKMKVECGDDPYDENPLEFRSILEYCPDCPLIDNDFFDHKPLNEALLMALNKSVEFDSLSGDNQLAFDMLFEIVSFCFTIDKLDVSQIQSIAYNKLKTIIIPITSSMETPSVQLLSENINLNKAIEISDKLITKTREYDDDIENYYAYLDKANFYYLKGNSGAARDIISQIPKCDNLDSNLTAFAKQKYCFYSIVEQLHDVINVSPDAFDNLMANCMGIQNRFGIGIANANIVAVLSTNNPIYSSSVIVDNIGNQYSTGSKFNTTPDFLVTKTDSTQNSGWEFVLDGWNEGIDSALVINHDNAGNLYVAGKSWNGVNYNLITVKVNQFGEPIWTAFYPFAGYNATPTGLSIDSNFVVSVYVNISDSLSSQFQIVKYSQCDTSCVARIQNPFNSNNNETALSSEFLKIYPNPAVNSLTIEFPKSEVPRVLSICDATGRIILSKKLTPEDRISIFDTSMIIPGVYTVILADPNTILNKSKLIIMK